MNLKDELDYARSQCLFKKVSKTDFSKSVLFKITKDGKTNHLYGSMHYPIEETNFLSIEAKTAFEEAECIVFEMLTNNQDELQCERTSI
ncbi:MAG: TraB/GumN family protein [Tatlockia sp.]|nr:TraB/GumN family protein [Tatlockia sp.]